MQQLLLLLLSRFSRVRLCATPWTEAYQAPPSKGFSRQEYWSGVPLPSPSCTKHSTKTVINYPIDDQGCPNCQTQRALLRPCGFQLGCWIWISWPSFIQPISSSTPVLGPANTKKHHFFFFFETLAPPNPPAFSPECLPIFSIILTVDTSLPCSEMWVLGFYCLRLSLVY